MLLPSRLNAKEIVLRQLLKLIYFYCSACTLLNYGIMELLLQKLVEPVTLVLSAGHLRYFLPLKAFSYILLFALETWALNGPGKHILSHHLGVLQDVHAAVQTGRNTGKTVSTQSLAP